MSDLRHIFPSFVAVICFSLICMIYYPGIMSGDGAFQYVQVKTGLISNLHPPLMAYLWQLSDAISDDYGLFWAMPLALYWLAITLLAYRLANGWQARTFIILLLGLWPPHLYITTAIWKDSWMVVSLLLAVWGMLSYSEKKTNNYLYVTLTMLLFTAAIRHNAIIALVPLVGWLCWKQSSYTVPWIASSKRTLLLAMTAMVLVITLILSWAINTIGVARTSMLPTISTWDLAAMSVAENKMLLPPEALGDASVTLDDIKREFAPANNTALCRYIEGRGRLVPCMEDIPHIRGALLRHEDVRTLTQHWLAMIAEYPHAYLAHRLRITCYLLDWCPHEWTGVIVQSFPQAAYAGGWYEGPPPEELGIHLREAGEAGLRINRGMDWLRRHTILMSGWPYLISLLASAVLLWRQRNGSGLAINASGWLMALPLCFIAPNLQIRYLVWPILASMLCWLLWWRARTQLIAFAKTDMKAL